MKLSFVPGLADASRWFEAERGCRGSGATPVGFRFQRPFGGLFRLRYVRMWPSRVVTNKVSRDPTWR